MENFMSRYRNGIVSVWDIDEYIEDWHRGDTELELYQYLGMTWEEYEVFVSTNELPLN